MLPRIIFDPRWWWFSLWLISITSWVRVLSVPFGFPTWPWRAQTAVTNIILNLRSCVVITESKENTVRKHNCPRTELFRLLLPSVAAAMDTLPLSTYSGYYTATTTNFSFSLFRVITRQTLHYYYYSRYDTRDACVTQTVGFFRVARRTTTQPWVVTRSFFYLFWSQFITDRATYISYSSCLSAHVAR